ncbi:MAG: non-canonical purine NTP pyrophosphatase [Planctomycetes bacterium]|nr:non-canonical purine NTP pyrophosphatase [Planctomycetota bacterium]NOG54414.1 non-canonical purine NTP pyrophosphatase [Planctomycetota bacterium]
MTQNRNTDSHPLSPGRPAGALTIIVATTNANKVREIISVLDTMRATEACRLPEIRFIPLDESAGIPEAVEDGSTFSENAALKAGHYARHTGHICLADDSGLEVDALDGAPGIHSARFAADEHDDFESRPRPQRDALNNEKLITQLVNRAAGATWTARFVCSMCLTAPDGTVMATARGTLEGVITDQPAGHHGFGYDPHVFLPDLGCTLAELSADRKNARSHRGNATRSLLEKIASMPS